MRYMAQVIGVDNDGHGITFYSDTLVTITRWARAQANAHPGHDVEIYEMVKQKIAVERVEVEAHECNG